MTFLFLSKFLLGTVENKELFFQSTPHESPCFFQLFSNHIKFLLFAQVGIINQYLMSIYHLFLGAHLYPVSNKCHFKVICVLYITNVVIIFLDLLNMSTSLLLGNFNRILYIFVDTPFSVFYIKNHYSRMRN